MTEDRPEGFRRVAALLAAQGHAPGKRVPIRSHAQEATEFENGVSNLTGPLVDHQVVDRAKLVAGGVVDIRPFNLVG